MTFARFARARRNRWTKSATGSGLIAKDIAGRFKVALTVFEMPGFMYAGIDQWEAALSKAKAREPDAWAPLIQSYDF